MRRPRRPAQELRVAIDWLPIDTKRAMLDAIEHNRIIVGAYTDRHGGVCPMLAAHRNGGRTELRELRPRLGPLHAGAGTARARRPSAS